MSTPIKIEKKQFSQYIWNRNIRYYSRDALSYLRHAVTPPPIFSFFNYTHSYYPFPVIVLTITVCIHGSLIKGIINHVFLVFLYFLIFVQVSKKIFYVNLVSLYMQTLFFFFIIINGYLKLARCIVCAYAVLQL